MVEIKTERKPWIDALRALAMLFVLYGHLIQDETAFFVFTSPIKIPLFFAITGYLFKDRDGKVTVFLKNLFRTLVIPWLILSFVPIILLSVLYGVSYFKEQAISILIGENVWYMPCCIVAEIIYFLFRKFLKRPWMLTVAAVLSFGIGLLLDRWNILNFFMINRAFVVQIFILAGYWIKRCEERISKIKLPYIISVGILYIGLCVLSIFAFPGECMDVHKNYYYNIPFCLLLIFVGLFALFAIVSRLKTPKVMSFIGQNTLVFYIWSGYAYWFITVGLKFLKISLPDNLLVALAVMIVESLICACAAYLLNHFLPEVVGKKRRKKNKVKHETAIV